MRHYKFETLPTWDWKYGQVGFIMKNWRDNPQFGCTIGLPKLIKEYLKIENGMVSENEDFIADFNLFEED